MKLILIYFLIFSLGCSREYPERISKETSDVIMSLAERAMRLDADDFKGLPPSVAGPGDYQLVGKDYLNPVSGKMNSHSVQLFTKDKAIGVGIWVGNSAREGYVAIFVDQGLSDLGVISSRLRETNYRNIFVYSAAPD